MKVKVIAMILLLLSLATNVMGQEGKYNLGRGYRAFVEIEEDDYEDIQKFLDRRKPGSSQFTTQRKEADSVEILSGIFEGKTTGTPISMVVEH